MKVKHYFPFLILLATLLIPRVVLGLAGWAEYEHTYYYAIDITF